MIKHLKEYGPIFGGGWDLRISDRGNIKNSSGNICHTYGNSEYRYNDEVSWKRFIGGDSYEFKI
jgi:hypothetical protein